MLFFTTMHWYPLTLCSASYFELNGLLKTLTPSSTPLLLYQNDPHLPVMKLENFSVKCRTQLTVHNLFGGETEKELGEMIAAVKNQLADVSTLFWSNFLLCWYIVCTTSLHNYSVCIMLFLSQRVNGYSWITSIHPLPPCLTLLACWVV